MYPDEVPASEWNDAYQRVTLEGPLTVTLVSDGGPWAVHDMPCPVCLDRTAIVDLGGGGFGPCGACVSQGWRLVKGTPPMLVWHRRLKRQVRHWFRRPIR